MPLNRPAQVTAPACYLPVQKIILYWGAGKSLFISLPVSSTIKKNINQEEQDAGQEGRAGKPG